jgi:hypothetical protein
MCLLHRVHVGTTSRKPGNRVNRAQIVTGNNPFNASRTSSPNSYTNGPMRTNTHA